MHELTVALTVTQMKWAKQKGEKTGLGIDGFIRYLIERDMEAHRSIVFPGETISPHPLRAAYTFERGGGR